MSYFRGLKFVGKNRPIRIRELAKVLIANKYDIVCLQELWCEEDFEYLKLTCEERFKYSHYFKRFIHYVSILKFLKT